MNKRQNNRSNKNIKFLFKTFVLMTSIISLYSTSSYANNTWTLLGDLNTKRNHHSSTVLMNGKVFVTGGTKYVITDGTNNLITLNSTEILDINTSTWSLQASMNENRKNHVAMLLDDGRVFITGGENDTSELSSAEIYDPLTTTWTTVANMSSARVNALITKLQDGRILVSSGHENNALLNSAEIYNPASNTWSSTGTMLSDATHTNAAVLLDDGRVFIKGDAGYTKGPGVDPSTYVPETPVKLPQVFNPTQNTWSAVSPMNTPKRGGTSIKLNDGNVLIVGGDIFYHDGFGYPLFTCDVPAEIYHPTTDTWTVTGTMVNKYDASKVSLLPDGNILAFGASINTSGYSCSADGRRAEIYDTSTGTWSVTDTAALRHNNGGAVSTLIDGKVLSIGAGTDPAVVEVYTQSGPSPISPPRAEVTHISDIDSISREHDNFPSLTWSAIVTFTVRDQNNNIVKSARVSAFTSTAQSVAHVCETNASGQCSIESGGYTSSSASMWVTNITKPLTTYDALLNSDPDGDSDGTKITTLRGNGPTVSTSNVHIGDLDGTVVNINSKRWQSEITITTHNIFNETKRNATVHGQWSGSVSGSASCTTDISGTCKVLSDRMRSSSSVATFTVTDIVHSTDLYDATLNNDPDNDSDGTVISVTK